MMTHTDAMNRNPAATAGRTVPSTKLLAATVLILLASSPSAMAQSPKEMGRWLDHTGDGAVELYACGGKVCGRIIWLKNPLGKDGRPLYDGYNPDPSMRSRPICGLQVLGNLTRQTDGSLDGGWVYDPKVGQSFNAALELEGRNSLVLTGYKGVRLFGKSFNWSRAPSNLPPCTSSTSASR